MSYEEFLEAIEGWARENNKFLDWEIRLMRDGYTSEDETELMDIRSSNLKYHKLESDVLKGDFLIFKKDDVMSNLQAQYARFPVDRLYEDYQKGSWEQVEGAIGKGLEYCLAIDKDILNHLNDYDMIKDRLIIRAINYPDNRQELRDKVYRVVGDIALTLYGELGEFAGNYTTFKIFRVNLDAWGISKDEAIDYALANTNILYPPRMYQPTQMQFDHIPYTEGAFMALNSKIRRLDDHYVPMMTCTRLQNGATGFFYPGVQERLAELYDGDYYVVFTAISEYRLHKVGTANPRELLSRLKGCNKMFPKVMLTRKIYQYSREKKELIMLSL